MKRFLAAAAVVAITTLSATTASADTLRLRADIWCPYNCEPGAERPGYMIEVAREALTPFGHEIEYRTLNWMRSVAKAKAGQIEGVIGAVAEEVVGLVLGPPLAMLADGIVTKDTSTIELDGPMPFEGLKVGAIQGYEYYGPLAKYIEANAKDRYLVQFVHGDDALAKNLAKLSAGRIDVVAEDMNVLNHRLRTQGLDGLKIHSLDTPVPGYIAFSSANPKAKLYAEQLTQGVERLRASGRLAEILGAYGLKDWQ